jgi:HSP20 family molecular chaperone IbpA
MTDIEQAIVEVERLYRAVTGEEVPKSETPYAPIPAERNPMQYVEEQLEKLVGILARPPLDIVGPPPITPPLSLWETETQFVFQLDRPGVSRERVQVEFRDRSLDVFGTRPMILRERCRPLISERSFSSFHRIIPLPQGVEARMPSIEIIDGVLELRIDKGGGGKKDSRTPES